MTEYTLDLGADINGTCGRGEVIVSPQSLVTRFGRPREADGCKVSGMYVFRDAGSNVYTVYDWKSTTLYDETGFPPEMFWMMRQAYEFGVGARPATTDAMVQQFLEWLKGEVR